MFKKFALAVALAAAASSSFAAAPAGFYAGLDVGSTRVDNIDGNQASFGGSVGYGFNRYVAFELGYRQLGKWDMFGGSVKLAQPYFSVVGFYPLSQQFDIYGRFGHNAVNTDSSVRGFTYNDDANGGLYGVGLNYDFSPAVSGRVEVQKPMRDIVNYNVGLVFKF
jgi:Outer membrane protein beta-barrel domain